MTLELNDAVLRKRVFKQNILDLHLKDFMIGQTTPYLNQFKNTLDIGAATGMYASHFAKHSKSVICFEAVKPVYDQLIKIKENFGNVITHNLAVSNFVGNSSFYVDDKTINIFRPEAHHARFNRSCRRMCIPETSYDVFIDALENLLRMYRMHLC